jgi:hypothetical protein
VEETKKLVIGDVFASNTNHGKNKWKQYMMIVF